MAKRTYEIAIEAKIDEAVKAVDKLSNETQKRLDKLNFNTGISAITDAFRLAESAIRPVFNIISNVVNEAIEAEKSLSAVANAMRITGDFTQAAVDDMAEFATQVSRTTEFTDDQVLANIALAKSFQLTNNEAKSVINAAKELSAITGDDLSTSVEKLAKTYNGFVDKSLKQLIPELKNLTEEQLAAGDAVEIVANRFSGSAATAAQNFGSTLTSVSKAAADLAETLGNVIVKSEGTKGVFKQIADDINALNDAINAGNFTNLFFNLKVGEGFSDAAKRLKEIETSAQDAEQAIKNAMRANTRVAGGDNSAEEQIKAQRRANLAREKALEDFNGIRKSLEMAGLTDIERIQKDAAKQIAIVRKAIETGAISDRVQAQKYIEGIQIDSARKVAEEQKKITEKQIAEEKRMRQEALERTKSITELDFSSTGDLSGLRDVAALSTGILRNVVKGAQGAVDVISKGIGAAADLLLPGIGGAVADIVGVLAQGPEQTKKMVEEFARAIPQIIENLAQSLPVLIETLARELPPALAKAMPQVALSFSTALIANLPAIVKGFAQGLIDAAKQAGQALIDAVTKPFGDGGLFGGGGGKGLLSGSGIPIIEDIGDFLGLAGGGRVPDTSQFSGDKFGPVMLDRNEQVLNGDLTEDLEQFLQEGPRNRAPTHITIVLKLDRQELARANLDLSRNDYRTQV